MATVLLATRRLIVGATFCYSIGILGLAAIWSIDPLAAWWVELSNLLALLLFVPLLLLLPLALALRSVPMRVAVAAVLLAFVALFGARFLPPVAAAPQGTPLRVITFNQLFANQQVDTLVAAIRAQHADLVAIQELSIPVAAALARDLAAEYPYQYLRPFDNQQGLGLISRYPFASAGETQNNLRGQQVTLAINGQTLTLMNMHLSAPIINVRHIAGIPIATGYDTSSPTHQVGRLAELIDQTSGPLVVLGDFNTGDREPRYAELARRMQDAFRATNWGFGFTFPDHKRFGPLVVPWPLLRIDYVWSKGAVQAQAARVECNNTGADHCLMVADLRLAAAQP
ncbi:MAG: endonuclease/exonuclease/phosphatase family protein [Kouleothrix sp.]